MISAEALAALGGLEHGARYNTICVTARELIGAGLASDDWGQLRITETGRIYLRRGKFNMRIDSDDVSDLAMQVTVRRSSDHSLVEIDNDPMAAPHRAGRQIKKAPPVQLELLPEAPAEPQPELPPMTKLKYAQAAALWAKLEAQLSAASLLTADDPRLQPLRAELIRTIGVDDDGN